MHFHREKVVDVGGPDDGTGRKGGAVIRRGNAHRRTLLHLKSRKHVVASTGKPGEEQNRTGADGKDEILEVPLGTVARRAETGEIIGEVKYHGDTFVLTAGGRGGRGNAYFTTPTQQAPQHAQPGEPAIEEWIVL